MNNIELIASTVINDFGSLPTDHDLSYVRACGKGTAAEKIIEYAGRLCYQSTARMGTSPDFIGARVREGHEDIVEHSWVTLRLDGLYSLFANSWQEFAPYLNISRFADGSAIVSGNLRSWLQLLRAEHYNPHHLYGIIGLIAPLAPSVFLNDFGKPNCSFYEPVESVPVEVGTSTSLVTGQARVTLLGYSILEDKPAKHSHATMLFDGVSRTWSHQEVRHRRMSFSQASQRFIDLSKGGWKPIIPPSIAANPPALTVMNTVWSVLEESYTALREMDIRKEDARFILPNACETRMVVSGDLEEWKRYFWQRALDKAAQWEIRQTAQAALEILYPLAPEHLETEWAKYQEMTA